MAVFNELVNVLLEKESIVCVGAGGFALEFLTYIEKEHQSIFEKIRCFLDDNPKNTKITNKPTYDFEHLILSEDKNIFYVVLTSYPDASRDLVLKLKNKGVDKQNIFSKNENMFPIFKILLKYFDIKLDVCECGARGETRVIKFLLEAFGNKCDIYGFDPDIENQRNINETKGENYKAYPYIVDSTTKNNRKLYQIKEDGHATFYPPDEDICKKISITSNGKDSIRTHREFVFSKTISLDDWKKTHNIKKIDYLYVNVDSAEHDLLLGARELLKNSILFAEIETYLNQFYKGQPLWGEIDNIMRKYGFEIVDIFAENRSAYKTPFNFTDGFLIHMNSIYCKKLWDLQNDDDYKKAITTVALLDIFNFKGASIVRLKEIVLFAKKNNYINFEKLVQIQKDVYDFYALTEKPKITFEEWTELGD